MKDKEKQIEEMKDIVHNLWDKLNQDAITTNDIIDALYNAGYRKIDEFAERLKEKFYYVFGNEYEQSVSGFDTKVLIEYIDELLKEYEK